MLDGMPNVAAWLRHGAAAEHIVSTGSPHLHGTERVRALSLENVIAQINHLRTTRRSPPRSRGRNGAARLVRGHPRGQVLGLDGVTGQFVPMREDQPLPVALPAARRISAEGPLAEAAE
jgi:carbonic anhydrase